MKYTYLYIIISLLVFSCESKEPIEVKQIISKETVSIEDDYMNRAIVKDSFRITIPTEYEIKINSDIYYINWFYQVDNKILSPDRIDYQVYNKQNKTKEILQLNFDKSHDNKQITIIIKERKHLISKKEALDLLKKYNIDKSLKDLKSSDEIELTTYDKFRMDNKEMINNFNKINDSVNFRVMKSDGTFFYVDKKIDW